MRVTICELPHETESLAAAWTRLCEHTRAHRSELVLLPEFAMLEPIWESERFDIARWCAIETLSDAWLRRLPELCAEHVVGTRPWRIGNRHLDQAFLRSYTNDDVRIHPLRSKFFLPEEPGTWEATWFDKGDPEFPVFRVGAASFGVNICTELWALETYAAYAAFGIDLLLSPRATARETAENWLALGVVAALRSGAFSLSSNRVDPTGACGGGGWIIDPSGEILAVTSEAEPFATRDLDLAKSARSRESYPRYVFAEPRASEGVRDLALASPTR